MNTTASVWGWRREGNSGVACFALVAAEQARAEARRAWEADPDGRFGLAARAWVAAHEAEGAAGRSATDRRNAAVWGRVAEAAALLAGELADQAEAVALRAARSSSGPLVVRPMTQGIAPERDTEARRGPGLAGPARGRLGPEGRQALRDAGLLARSTSAASAGQAS